MHVCLGRRECIEGVQFHVHGACVCNVGCMCVSLHICVYVCISVYVCTCVRAYSVHVCMHVYV